MNTYDDHNGVDQLDGPHDVASFIRVHSSEWRSESITITEGDVDEVRAVRAQLRAVIAADHVETSVAALNELIERAAARPRVSLHDGTEPHLHFEPFDASPVRWLATVTAMGLSIVLVEEGLERFGVCDSSTCGDVFVDTSRNRSRRNCSDRCTTRENVAAYRQRKRT